MSDARRPGVLQLIDSLMLGGAERVAVNFANRLPRDRYDVHLCSTRDGGPLVDLIDPEIGYLAVRRTRRWHDLPAARRIARYVRRHGIQIMHAHQTTVFLSNLVKLFVPRVKLVWHDHYGRQDTHPRATWLYRAATLRADAVFSVNESLAEWTANTLRFRRDRIWYVPNFVESPRPCTDPPKLPGESGNRIVFVGRIVPQKDLLNLVRAMRHVCDVHPSAQVLLVGEELEPGYAAEVRAEAERLGVIHAMHWLGPRTDVGDVLQACDLAVLPSSSEGLPLVLLEYCLAGLAPVVTDVGQCAEVVEGGRAGILVPPRDPEALAQGLVRLLQDPDERGRVAERARRSVAQRFTPESVMAQVGEAYEQLLA